MPEAASEAILWNLMVGEARKRLAGKAEVGEKAVMLGDAWAAEITSKIDVSPLPDKLTPAASVLPAGASQTLPPGLVSFQELVASKSEAELQKGALELLKLFGVDLQPILDDVDEILAAQSAG